MSDSGDLLAGRYRLRQRVGSGAMGVVWEATDERLQRQVAVKQLLQQAALDPERADEARERVMREGRVAARLHHPNAIGVFDVVLDDGMPVLVMEYLRSRSLADILAEQHHLDPATVARIGGQVASALAAAHAAGIVHRDIKPANVLIAEDGTAKITDFGISHATGDVVVTQTGLVAGTPAYLAPEVARGQRPTPGSDVFSLAATLYAAVEGAPPFGTSEDNALALLYKVAEGAVPAPRNAGSLTPVLGAMLRADPDQRITAAQVGEGLRSVALGLPLPAPVAEATAEWGSRTGTPGATATMPSTSGGRTATDMPPGGEQGSAGPDRTLLAPGAAGKQRPPRLRKRAYLFAAVALALLAGLGLYALLGPDEERGAGSAVSMAAAERERAVSEYYALLPDRAEQAWSRLGPELREQGKQPYLERWSEVSAVAVTSSPRATGDDSVRVEVELSMPDGSVVTEAHELTLIAAEDELLINGDDVLRRDVDAPAPDPQPSPQTPQEETEPQPGQGNDDDDEEGEPEEEEGEDQDEQEETPPPAEDDEPPEDETPPAEPPEEEGGTEGE
ncbi:serine/threonine protein kinase [Haloechinothrix sp. YIM 98757]|uniref:non-specific serine/threonine protein kinase n=1 Tax=Haloechinothrix aidingensis TaxID=2752311 RepID=A0A838A601_9PSEU|nr:serine/threonine-protein kinase [Haloechinothrix aidingensis]MBA0125220.1 serine/threonine protein kinase [Haloechinothrix aidingensis]